MVSSGAGAKIAAPLLSMLVIPAAFLLLRGRELRKQRAVVPQAVPATAV